jgi:hypothetical protein
MSTPCKKCKGTGIKGFPAGDAWAMKDAAETYDRYFQRIVKIANQSYCSCKFGQKIKWCTYNALHTEGTTDVRS